jgi:ABC-type uncharacterized transport system auxiliary subunit
MKSLRFLPTILVIALTSCLSERTIVQKYYTLEVPEMAEPVQPKTAGVVPGSCELEQVKVRDLYNRHQIINRSGSNEVTFYQYHQWAVRPASSILELVLNYMEQKQVFEMVSARFGNVIPDYRLSTTVSRLEVVEEQKSFSARIQVEYQLKSNQNDSILVSHEVASLVPLANKDLNLFAETTSEVMLEGLDQFSALVRERLLNE